MTAIQKQQEKERIWTQFGEMYLKADFFSSTPFPPTFLKELKKMAKNSKSKII